MITFFNGHRRGLGENPAPTVYAQIDVSFREHLSHFKGARLAVLLAIALHANEEGWSWPSYETLAQETGYSEDAIRRALQDLCALEINGQRVLLRYQPPAGGNKTFESNRYLLFPSPEEVAQYEGMGTKHLGAETGGGFRRGKMPRREFPVVAKCHDEQTPIIGILIDQEEQEEEKEESGTSEIAKTLTENGVFPDVAREIAERMAGAGLSAEDALAILLGTIRSIQTGMPRGEEEIMSLAVDRMRRGIWDAGEQVRDTLRRARYAVTGPAAMPAPPPEQKPKTREEKLWSAALGELQLELTRATYETLLRHSRLVAVEDGTFVVGVASTYARDWLESRLRPVVARVLTRLIGHTTNVRFVVAEN